VQFAESYLNTQYNFSIDFPSGWVENENPDVVVQFSDPEGSATMNIAVEETPLSLSSYVSEAEDELAFNLPFFELLSGANRTISGLDGYELTYTWIQVGSPNPNIWNKQVFFVEDGKAYVITCGADYLEYSLYTSAFENSLDSFTLTATPTPTPTDTPTPTPTPTDTPTPTPTPTDTPTPANTIFGIRSSTLIIVAGIVTALVVLATVVILLRRKRQQPDKTSSESPSPSSSQPPPPPPLPPPPPQ